MWELSRIRLTSTINQEKERQTWEATCESLRSKLEASENACLRSEKESAEVKSKSFNTYYSDFAAKWLNV